MTDDSMSQCFSFLKAMNCGSEQKWDEGHKQIYAMVLRPLPDEVGRAAVEYAVSNCEWRPSPAELNKIASRVASPIPDAETSYAEIILQAQGRGIYAKPVEGRPNVFLEGPPNFSHPLVGRIVAMCGGWQMICTGEANLQGSLRRQVEATHKSVAASWEQDVSGCLAKGITSGPMFPKWKPIEIPSGWTEEGQAALPPWSPPEYDVVPIPEKIRKAIASIGGGMAPNTEREAIREQRNREVMAELEN